MVDEIGMVYGGGSHIDGISDMNGIIYIYMYECYTSSTAQGGGGSFKNRKPIGEVGCRESWMAERIH